MVDRIDVFQWSWRFILDIDIQNEIMYFEPLHEPRWFKIPACDYILHYRISELIMIITKRNMDVINMYYGMESLVLMSVITFSIDVSNHKK